MDSLVTVCIPTYNRPEVLFERAVPSALNQTYSNVEVLIIGDNCSKDVCKAIEARINDPRVSFYNLPARGEYPRHGFFRWLVAGSVPRNACEQLGKGEWFAPLDDDDEFTPDHIEKLMRIAIENDAEFVWGQSLTEQSDGVWEVWGFPAPNIEQIVHSSVLIHRSLAFSGYSNKSWAWWTPADKDRWIRLKNIGARMASIQEVVSIHYAEKSQVRGSKHFDW